MNGRVNKSKSKNVVASLEDMFAKGELKDEDDVDEMDLMSDELGDEQPRRSARLSRMSTLINRNPPSRYYQYEDNDMFQQ